MKIQFFSFQFMDPLNLLQGHPSVLLTMLGAPRAMLGSAHWAVWVWLLKAEMGVENQ